MKEEKEKLAVYGIVYNKNGKNNLIEICDTKTPVCILLRGIPGSGKSTLARFLRDNFGFDWHEADMWFYKTYYEYKWSKEDSVKAHEWCFEQFKNSIENRYSVVVSNTFIYKSQMERYIKFAKEHFYNTIILKAKGNFNNIHNVPTDTLERMRRDFEE